MTYTFYSHFPLNDLFQLFEKQSLQGDVLTHSKSLSGVVKFLLSSMSIFNNHQNWFYKRRTQNLGTNVLPFGTEMTLSLKGIPLALKW